MPCMEVLSALAAEIAAGAKKWMCSYLFWLFFQKDGQGDWGIIWNSNNLLPRTRNAFFCLVRRANDIQDMIFTQPSNLADFWISTETIICFHVMFGELRIIIKDWYFRVGFVYRYCNSFSRICTSFFVFYGFWPAGIKASLFELTENTYLSCFGSCVWRNCQSCGRYVHLFQNW